MTYNAKNPDELTGDDLSYMQQRENKILKRIKYLSGKFGEKGGPHTFTCPCCGQMKTLPDGVRYTTGGTVTYTITEAGGVIAECSTPGCAKFERSSQARSLNSLPITPEIKKENNNGDALVCL